MCKMGICSQVWIMVQIWATCHQATKYLFQVAKHDFLKLDRLPDFKCLEGKI